MTGDEKKEYREALRALDTLRKITNNIGLPLVLGALVGIMRQEAQALSEKAAANEEFATDAAFHKIRSALDDIEQRAKENLTSEPAKPLPSEILAIFKRDLE